MKGVFFGACAAMLLSGCATITRGTTEAVAIQTDPPGAEVRTSNGFGCPETPCQITVPRKDPFILTLTKPGFKQVDMTIGTTMNGGGTAGMVGNVVAGGIVGVVVDSSNGAAMDHTPNPVIVNLKPVETMSPVIRQRGRRAAPVS